MPAALAAATLVSVGSSIAGGISAQSAANQNAKIQEQQGGVALAEAKANATNEAYNQNQFLGKQRLAFLANGVSLEGSPALVQAQTQKYGQQQVQSILNEGQAKYNLAQENAQVIKNQGRAALIAGLGQAASSAASGAYQLNKAGAFDPTKSKTGVSGG